MQSIKKVKNLKGKTVLLRADFNVPMERGKVTDDFRIVQALPTIKYLKEEGAKIIIISHLGDDGDESLAGVAKILNAYTPITFVKKTIGFEVGHAIRDMEDGDAILLENLRQNEGEKENDKTFSAALASLAEIYVNDAFSVSHREHASIVGVPKLLPHYAGLQMMEEIKNLKMAFKPPRPFFFILGGAKFSTKLPLIENYLEHADAVFVGGALANTLLAARGDEVGASVYDKPTNAIQKLLNYKNLALPIDVVVKKGAEVKRLDQINSINKKDMIVDIGPETVEVLKKVIKNSAFVLWNGPLGFYEEGFDKGTRELLQALAESDAVSIIGGGDTVEIINEMKMIEDFNFVSTGGGATLDFLAAGTLPGIDALE